MRSLPDTERAWQAALQINQIGTAEYLLPQPRHLRLRGVDDPFGLGDVEWGLRDVMDNLLQNDCCTRISPSMNYEQRGQMRHHLGAYLLVRGAMGGAQGRIKDVIICGGENIYPREIEDVLFADPPSPRRRSSAFRTSSGVRW